MRIFLFLATIFAMFIVTIVLAYKPTMIEEKYAQIKAPVDQYFAAQRADAWRKAKEQAWKAWAANVRMPQDCATPPSSLRQLECENLKQLEAATFEKNWEQKVANGWMPEGVR